MSLLAQRFVGSASIVVFVAAAWYVWSIWPQGSRSEKELVVASRGEPASLAAASGVTPALSEPKANAIGQTAAVSTTPSPPNLVAALSSIAPPRRPTWDIVTVYRTLPDPSVEAQAEVFQALTYCANTRQTTTVLRSLRAEGAATDPAVSSLETTIQAHTKYCSRLSSADYTIRSDIISARARQGDVFAMQAFYEVGPTGEGHGSFEGMSRESARSWLESAINFLQLAANQGSVASLSTLSSIYKARDAEPTRSQLSLTLATVQDPIAAYAYQYAFAHQVGKSKSSRARLLNSAAVALTREQLQDAQLKGDEILRRCCNSK